MMPKHILMLLSNEYRPDPRVEKEAQSLMKEGYKVSIIAWYRDKSFKPGTENEEVHRIGTIFGHSKFSMAIGYPLFFIRSTLSVLRKKPDVIHANDLDTLPIGAFTAKMLGIPLVYDAHEHYGQMVAQDLPSPFIIFFDRFEAMLIPFVNKIIAANEEIADYLGIAGGKSITTVMNCIDEIDSLPADPPSVPTVFYGGSLEPMRYIEQVAQACERWPEVRMRIAGRGSLRKNIEDLAQKESRIQYIGYLSHNDLLKEMAASTIVLVMLDPINENNRIGTPNRLFEAMAIGVPVLVSAGTLSGKIVQRTGCGIVIEWSENAFKEALVATNDPIVRKTMGIKGRKAVREEFNWNEMSRRLLKVYREIFFS